MNVSERTCEHHDCTTIAKLVRGLCPKHYKRWQMHGDANIVLRSVRLAPEVALKNAIHMVTESGCWLIEPTRLNNCGYGVVYASGSHFAHRLSYETFVGPIPAGLVIDHLCRVRSCVNPTHLEPVTPRENVMRSPIAPAALNAAKTHCPQGHAYTPENTYRNITGRLCKACAKARYAATRKAGATA